MQASRNLTYTVSDPPPSTDALNAVVSGSGNSVIGSATSRPGFLVVGNSIAGQSCRKVASYTSATTAVETRASSTTVALVAGGVAALGVAVGDYVVVGLASQQAWPVQISAIAGDTLTLARRLPLLMRASAGVSKVTVSTLWPATSRVVCGVANAANMLAGSPFELLPGYGHGGALAADIVASLPALLRHHRPTVVALHLFENDLSGITALADMQRLLDMAVGTCLRYGARSLVYTPLPSINYSAARAPIYDAMVAYTLSVGSRAPGAVGVDVSTFYLDTSNPTAPRSPLAGWTDGVHPKAQRIWTIAAAGGMQAMQSLSNGARQVDWGTLIVSPNGALTGSGGTRSGTTSTAVVPDGYTLTANAGVTLDSTRMSDGRLRLTGSIPGASNVSTTQVIFSSDAFTFPSTWNPRTRVCLVADVEIISASQIFSLQATFNVGSVSADMRTAESAGEGLDAAMTGRRFTLESQSIPAADVAGTTASWQLAIRPQTLASPSGVAFDIILGAFGLVLSGATELDEGARALV